MSEKPIYQPKETPPKGSLSVSPFTKAAIERLIRTELLTGELHPDQIDTRRKILYIQNRQKDEGK